ncbi:MAG TPA: hydrogenase maturation protease [Pirellulales bacterium]|nr:hydrogenase maturation protease [Pirellulales bacterium]
MNDDPVIASRVPRRSQSCRRTDSRRTLIVGLGSPHGDDQLGWRVTERLALELASSDVDVRTARSAGDLLDWLDGLERLIVCDACENQGSPGTLHCWNWPAAELCLARASSSHDLGLASTLALADELGRLPGEVTIVAVEEKQHLTGAEMSAEVVVSVERVVGLIVTSCLYDDALVGERG